MAAESAIIRAAAMEWLESAPAVASEWFRDVVTLRNIVQQRADSFQMVGKYDGAMSEVCKDAFRRQYAFLDAVLEWSTQGNEDREDGAINGAG